MSNPTVKKEDLIRKAISDSKGETKQSVEEFTEKTEQAVTTALLGGSLRLGEFKVRPFTLATAAMLKQINSPLIMGIPIDSVPNIILDVLKLIVIQTFPLEKAVELTNNPSALDLEAYKLADSVSPSQAEKLVVEVMEELKSATETQVNPSDPNAKKKGKKGTESGNG